MRYSGAQFFDGEQVFATYQRKRTNVDSANNLLEWPIFVHHTVEDYFMALQRAGFAVTALRESRPQRALFTDEKAYERRQRIPLM